ncbi:MAG: type VI secretion system tip protein TssI/VgrG [Rhodospirillales bacterium]
MTAGQAARRAAVSSPLGDDLLLLRRLSAVDRMSRSFAFRLELVSENGEIRPEQVLGQRMGVRYELPAGGIRYFDGLTSQFCYLGGEGRYARYQARVDSWLWFLTRSTDCRIFQNKTVPQIVKQIFAEYPIAEYEDRLTAAYPARTYCVQYRETDYDFVNRLLEQEGIYYFFTHTKNKHTLILADKDSAPERIPDYERVPFYPPEEDGGIRERDHVSAWLVRQEVRSGASVLRDFDFEKPRANLECRRQDARPHAQADHELYDYPGIYLESDDGETYSRLRLEETQADQEIVEGTGDVAGLIPGCAFTLTKHPRDDQNREYRVLTAAFELTSDEYESRDGGGDGAGFSHRCGFTAMDMRRPYRPPRITAKPTVQGPQTAIVTGPAGEEIWTDKYGRVRVQFHWDRLGKRDENSSCWVRVSHPWAGKGWGAVAIPRIGQEVIVDFLEGDPDRPIITGRVYNAEAMPPYGLPAGAVQSGVKSNSTKGGGGYNEYVLDDTKGNELIREHGQFDKDSTIEHDLREHVLNSRFRDVKVDETILIGHDQTFTIDHNQTGTVGVDKTLTIGANHTESIGSNMTITVGSTLTETVAINYAETVGAMMSETVGAAKIQSIGASKTETIGANKDVDVGANQTINVGANQSTDIGGNKSEQVGGNKSVAVDGNLSETVQGQHSEAVTKAYALQAKTVTVTADDEILIKTGSASIAMKKNGDITIDGKKITITGSGDVVIKGQKILQN